MKYITRSEADTTRFGAALAAMLRAGDTVLLSGDLGTGKSVVARGIAGGLGIRGAMPSPTFTLMIPYTGDRKLYHFDLYRLEDPDEYEQAGLSEFVGGDGIALIEWPEMADIDPYPVLRMKLERGAGDDDRVIYIENDGIAGFDAAALREWEAEA